MSPFIYLIMWSGGVFLFAYLDHGATAVPPIGRIADIPERVGRRQRDTMQCSMFGTHLAIVLRSVLEIVVITVLLKLFPFGRHLGRGIDEVIFSTEVVAVVGARYFAWSR